MVRVAVSELKAKLAYYLRLAKSGEEIEILERGVSIASIVGKQEIKEDLIIPAQTPFEKLKNKKFTARLSKDSQETALKMVDSIGARHPQVLRSKTVGDTRHPQVLRSKTVGDLLHLFR